MMEYRNSQEAINDGWHFMNKLDSSVLITDYTGDSDKLVYPDTIGGKPVTTVARCSTNNIKKVKIGFGSTNLGNLNLSAQLFKNFPALENIELGPRITRIPDDFARNCVRLRTINMGPNISQIGVNAFAYTDIAYLSGNNSILDIGRGAFKHCRSLKSVILPSIKKLQMCAFFNCKSLTSVTLGDELQSLEASAFEATGLEEFFLPKSLKVLPELSFAECKNLTRVYLSEEIEHIAGNTFYSSPNISIIFY